MFVFIVGSSVTDADKNVAVLGVILPITVLLIFVSTTGTVDPDTPIVPVSILLTVITNPESPDSSNVEAELILGLVPSLRTSSLAVIVSPANKFVVRPIPPSTVSAPVVEDVESISPVILTVLNCPIASHTVISPKAPEP